MKTALVIMAAGIGSRFGGGIKQLEPVGMNGEIIMDYSIHDAIEAGFNKIVFIIRKDIEKAFREVIGCRIEKLCTKLNIEVAYAFQEKDNLPEGIRLPPERTKPWGTGQAVLSCKGLINEPFCVINADDYYGKEAFIDIYKFLQNYDNTHPESLCMAGFVLKNTLSDFGGVTRGICQVNSDGMLTDVTETYEIIKSTENGKVKATSKGNEIEINSLVSMNMWGLTPEFIDVLEQGFNDFFAETDSNSTDMLKKEYLLPIYINKLLKENKVTVKPLETPDKWFGVTYKEDKKIVSDSFKELIKKGVYREHLFDDLV